jgi:hypothetical protein
MVGERVRGSFPLVPTSGVSFELSHTAVLEDLLGCFFAVHVTEGAEHCLTIMSKKPSSHRIFRICSECRYHRIKGDDGDKASFCTKEGCFSSYAKCFTQKAIQKFMDEETIRDQAIG